jgi:Na+/H+ antiporter NhaD/arsenite permease-like protein
VQNIVALFLVLLSFIMKTYINTEIEFTALLKDTATYMCDLIQNIMENEATMIF